MLHWVLKAVGKVPKAEIPTHKFLGRGAFSLAHIVVQSFNNRRPIKRGHAVRLRHGPRLCCNLT